MKRNLLKTMLAATVLFAGTIGAWAQTTTTIYERGTSDATAWTSDNLTDFTASGGTYELTDYGAQITSKNGTVKVEKTIAPTANAVVNVEAVWLGMSNTGRDYSKGNASYFRFGNIYILENDQDKKAAYSLTTFSASNHTTFTGPTGWRAYDASTRPFYVIKMEINTATDVLNYLRVYSSSDESTALLDLEDQQLTDVDYSTIGFGYIKSGSMGNNQVEILKSIKVTETTQSIATANYTIKYVDASGNEIKTSETRTGVVGGSINLTTADKASIYTGEGLSKKKYIYDSDDASENTIAEGDGTVVTVKFREAELCGYRLDAVDVDGKTLQEGLLVGADFEGETINIAYPYALKFDSNTLYTSAKQNSGYYFPITLSEKTTVKTVTYTASDITDVVYFSEAEKIEGLTLATNGNTAVRSSYGASAYAADSDVVFTKLSAGKYKLTTVICDATSKAGSVWNFKAGNDTIFTFTATSVNWSSGTSDEFTLTEDTEIALCKGGNANQAVDFIYIQRTGDYTAPYVAVEKFSDLYDLKDGTDVNIKTSDAVISVWQYAGTGNFVCVQDGTGAVRLSDDMASMMSGIGLYAGSKVVGNIYAKYREVDGTPTLVLADSTQFSSIDTEAAGEVVDVAPVEMTIAEAKQKSSISKYVEIKKAKMWADEDDWSLFYISQGTDTIKVYDKFWALPETFTAPDTIEYVKGVVVLEDDKYTIYPYGEDAVPVVVFEAENIAALANAEENSTVKLMLKDAQITVVSDGRWGTTAYLEDESGAVEFGDVYDFISSESELDLKEGTVFNGYIMVMYAGNWGGMQIMSTDETVTGSIFSVEDDTPTPMETTIAEVKKESNCSRFVSFKNTKIVTERSAEDEDGYSSITAIYMVQGTDSLQLYDAFGTLPVDDDNLTVVPDSLLSSEGILGYSDGIYYFSPSKIEIADAGPDTGINGVAANASARKNADVYSVGGVKMRKEGQSLNGLSKGLYIINGKKVVIK